MHAGGLRYGVGANLGFRRDVFEAIGGFDETFCGPSDDIDFCLRAQYAGYTLGFVPEALVHYRVRDSLREIAKQSYSYALGTAHLCRKHIELGKLARRRLRNTWTVINHARRLVRVRALLDSEGRMVYVRDAAWIAGGFAGYFRYGILV